MAGAPVLDADQLRGGNEMKGLRGSVLCKFSFQDLEKLPHLVDRG